MPNPTRSQIEASFASPTFQVQFYISGVWTTIGSQYIVSVDGSSSSTINEENPIGFGDSSENTCTLVVTYDMPITSWVLIPVRIYMGFEGNNKLYFTGIITDRSRDQYTITYTCGGFNNKIENTTAYSPIFFNRPAATQTTVSSVEDPSNVGYRAGLINFILWKSGGRPLEQDFSYPNAVFYYSCDPALYRTYASWVAGENIWQEALKIARASGGQLYQDTEGIVRYRNPLSFGSGTPIFTFTESTFQSISESGTTAQLVGEVRCNYTPRFIAPLQQVYQETSPKLLDTGKTEQLICETQWPLYRLVLDPSTLQLPKKEEMIQAVYFDGSKAEPTTGFTIALVESSAQRVVFNITNVAGRPIVIHKITLYGEPLLSMDQKSFSFGSGEPQKILEDNVYIQTEAHAERLCRMVKDFYGISRPTRTLSGCGFDPDRYVGEVVLLTYTLWGLTSSLHRIVDITHASTGSTMDVTLVPIDGLPTDTTFYIVDNTYAGSDVKQLGY